MFLFPRWSEIAKDKGNTKAAFLSCLMRHLRKQSNETLKALERILDTTATENIAADTAVS